MPVNVRIRKMTPERKTAPRAVCHGTSHALDYRVGEVGVEAHSGRERDGVAGEGSHQDAAEGRGEAGGGDDRGERHAGFVRMVGFTKMMYAIVMKVVKPARISVRQLVRGRRRRSSGSEACADTASDWCQVRFG